ncbi:MAG TPA: bestrophin family ion channel [Chitinophagales bacterium]|nr:bestrophin family ion channel [Chitinophagales bacterium]
MYTRHRYGFWMTFNWSKKPFIWGAIYAFALTIIFEFVYHKLHFDFSFRWQPISVLGIAVAFYLGFKNNASYDRTWEARKIWGGIVNNSRSFGAAVSSFIQGENSNALKKELIHRHIAWLTALRFQLRLAREWEHTNYRINSKYSPNISELYFHDLEEEVKGVLCEEEFDLYKGKTNMAAQIMHKQAIRLQELKDQGYFDDFRHIAFHNLITEFYADQGRSERIKNFPFPRQYASVAVWMTMIFAILTPFGLLNVFHDLESHTVWLAVPFSALLIWVFFLMEMIGDFSENPFEGTYNDVPITAIARSIEIDLREMLGETDIPKPLTAENGFLM